MVHSVSAHIMGSHIVYKLYVNNMGSHNVRTHWMHHVRILSTGLKMAH